MIIDSFEMRDAACNRVSIDLGERDEDGFYTPTLTTHYDDNPLKQSEAEIERLKCCGNCTSLCYSPLYLICLRRPDKSVPDSWEGDVRLSDSCHFTPSRWERRR